MSTPPLDPHRQGELRAWTLAAVAALATSGVLAPMLALSRAPGLEAYLPWAEQAFVRAIIEHVVFSVVVWTFAVFGGLLCVSAHPRAAALGRWGVWLMPVVFVSLFVPSVLSGAEPSLNNYIPVMIHPLYYTGVVLLFVALALPVLRFFVNLSETEASTVEAIGGTAASVAFAAALLSFVLAWVGLGDIPPSIAYNEDLFWGGGHALQVVNAILMLTAWAVLGRLALSAPLLSVGTFRVAVGIAAAAALLAPLFYARYSIDDAGLRDAHSLLKFYLVMPTLLVGLAAVPALGRGLIGGALKQPAFVALALSMLTFGVGGVMGYFADGLDTRTPGHYHGVLGGVNLAFFGLVLFSFLPAMGRALPQTRWRFAPLYIYALGQILQSVGMFVAAAPRKTMGQAQMLETATEKFGMHLNNTGALIAVIGGILFVWIAGRALLRRNASNVT